MEPDAANPGAALAVRARDGDRDPFASLVELHWIPLVRLAREAAVESVETWRFEPARDANGNPVKVYYNLTINFRLEDPQAQGP